jgi:hypothetical protein
MVAAASLAVHVRVRRVGQVASLAWAIQHTHASLGGTCVPLAGSFLLVEQVISYTIAQEAL